MNEPYQRSICAYILVVVYSRLYFQALISQPIDGWKNHEQYIYQKNLDFQYNDTWGTLCSNKTWHRYTASAICLSMGFGYGAARLVPLELDNMTLFWEDTVHSEVR